MRPPPPRRATTTAATTTTAGPTTTAATTTTTLPPGKPYGGQAIFGSDQEPATLNTFAPGGDNVIVVQIAQTWQCGVQEIDGYTLEFIPDLVTELPTVANGGIVVNADGTETVQLHDPRRSDLGRRDPGLRVRLRVHVRHDHGPGLPDVHQQIYEDIIPESVVAGDKTFEFTLAQPTVQAELIFGAILPKHQVEGTDFMADYNETGWLSCGPFKVDSVAEGRVRQGRPQRQLLEDRSGDRPAAALPGQHHLPVHPGDAPR